VSPRPVPARRARGACTQERNARDGGAVSDRRRRGVDGRNGPGGRAHPEAKDPARALAPVARSSALPGGGRCLDKAVGQARPVDRHRVRAAALGRPGVVPRVRDAPLPERRRVRSDPEKSAACPGACAPTEQAR